MAEHSGEDLSPVGASFATHLRQFHASLPAEEQALLEEILALADQGLRTDDARGHIFNMFANFGDIPGESTDEKHRDWIEVRSFPIAALLKEPRR